MTKEISPRSTSRAVVEDTGTETNSSPILGSRYPQMTTAYSNPIPRNASVLEQFVAYKKQKHLAGEMTGVQSDVPPHLMMHPRQQGNAMLTTKDRLHEILRGVDEQQFPESLKPVKEKKEKIPKKSVRELCGDYLKRNSAAVQKGVDITVVVLLVINVLLFTLCFLPGKTDKIIPQLGVIDITPGSGDFKGSLKSYKSIFGLSAVKLNSWGYCISAKDYVGCFADPPNLGEVPEILPPETARNYDTFIQEFAEPIAQWTMRDDVIRALYATGVGMSTIGVFFGIFVACKFPLVSNTIDYYCVVLAGCVDLVVAAVVLAVTGVTHGKVLGAFAVRRFDLQVQLGGVFYVTVAAFVVSLLAAVGVAFSFFTSKRTWARRKEYL